MTTGILNRLPQMSNDELLELSEAIDVELEHRTERLDEVPDSARRRAIQRQKSYRRNLGASGIPVRYVGMKDVHPRRRAA